MSYLVWCLPVILAWEVLKSARWLQLGRYPRITMIPVLNEAGEATKLQMVQRFTAGSDKFRIVTKLIALAVIVVVLTN